MHGTEIHCAFKEQNGTIAGLNDYNYVVADGEGLKPSFDFVNGTGLSYIVRIKVPANTKCIEYTPCTYWQISSSENKEIHYNTNIYAENSSDVNLYAAWQPANTSTISLNSAATAGQDVYLALPAINNRFNRYPYGQSPYEDGNLKDGVIVTFLNADSENADKSWGTVIANDLSEKGGLVNTMDCSEIEMIARPKPSEAVPMTASYTRTSNPAFSVSGTISWAPYNVGASSANEAGYYFQWGEIEDSGGSPAYSNYNFGTGSNAITSGSSKYDAYATISILQYTGLGTANRSLFTIQQSRYDAARVLWGSAWRMPNFPEASGTAANSTCSLSTNTWTMTSKDGNANSVTFYKSNWKTKGYDAAQRPNPGSSGAQLTYDMACYWTATQQNRLCPLAGFDTAMLMGHTSSGDWDWWDGKAYRERAVPIRAVLASSSVTVQ